MSDYKEEYIKYRIENSEQAYLEAKLLALRESWNGCINRLYYSCYYIVSALAVTNDIQAQTHSGLRS